MVLVFKKDDPLLAATVLALILDPMPHTYVDNDAEFVSIDIQENVQVVRIYRLGIRSGHLLKAVSGMLKDYGKAGRFNQQSIVQGPFEIV